jgi:hypothetical protein
MPPLTASMAEAAGRRQSTPDQLKVIRRSTAKTFKNKVLGAMGRETESHPLSMIVDEARPPNLAISSDREPHCTPNARRDDEKNDRSPRRKKK